MADENLNERTFPAVEYVWVRHIGLREPEWDPAEWEPAAIWSDSDGSYDEVWLPGDDCGQPKEEYEIGPPCGGRPER
jgi:hypothetical protein